MKLYKYTNRQWVEPLLNNGSLKIGTLYGYRKIEHSEIGDPGEGKAYVTRRIQRGTFTTGELPQIASQAIVIGEGVTVDIRDMGFALNGEVPDAYVYCIARTPSKQSMIDFDCDVCIEISDAYAFGILVAQELYYTDRIDYLWPKMDLCKYGIRSLEIKHDNDSEQMYWLKEPRHFWQDEFRFVFQAPRGQMPLKDLYIDVPAICPFLREIEL